MPMAKLMGFIGAKVRLERELIDVCVCERERESNGVWQRGQSCLLRTKLVGFKMFWT